MQKKTSKRLLITLITTLCISFILPYFAMLSNAEDLEMQKTFKEYEKQIKENEKRLKENEKVVDEKGQTILTLQTDIDALEKKSNALNEQIEFYNKEIKDKETAIAENEQKMIEEERAIKKSQKDIGKRMKTLYMQGPTHDFEMFFKPDTIPEKLNILEIVERNNKKDFDNIKLLRKQTEEWQRIKEELTEQVKELNEDKSKLKVKIDEYNENLEKLSKKRNELKKEVSKIEKNSKKLKKYNNLVATSKQAYLDMINAKISKTASVGNGSVDGKLIWPVPDSSNISSGFGPRWGRFHYGIDIAAPKGTTVLSAGAGKVTEVSTPCTHDYPKYYNCGCNGGYGNLVVIDHGDGLLTYYAHLQSASVREGQVVACGQEIGKVGCTGHSTGDHLHFEVRVNDSKDKDASARNPLNFVKPI